MQYIKDNAGDTDIFCFQEVFSSTENKTESRGIGINILNDINKTLPDFVYYFSPEGEGFNKEGPVEFEISGGQAIFLKKQHLASVKSEGNVFVFGKLMRLKAHEWFDVLGSNLQYLRLESEGKKLTVGNVHCLPHPGHKLDTPARLKQSQNIKQFLDGEKGAKILCGDFNLLPETESIKMIEDAGMINLIKKFNIELTRSRLSPWWRTPNFQKFADYTFVSPDVNVISFSVPDLAVSDHLPMVLEFS